MVELFILSLAVSAVAWTVTQEELFKEFRTFCISCKNRSATISRQKFFYLFTCHYCFSHYVTAAMLFLTGYKLVLSDWRGYVVAFFAIVWIANVFMTVYAIFRQILKLVGMRASLSEKELLK